MERSTFMVDRRGLDGEYAELRSACYTTPLAPSCARRATSHSSHAESEAVAAGIRPPE